MQLKILLTNWRLPNNYLRQKKIVKVLYLIREYLMVILLIKSIRSLNTLMSKLDQQRLFIRRTSLMMSQLQHILDLGQHNSNSFSNKCMIIVLFYIQENLETIHAFFNDNNTHVLKHNCCCHELECVVVGYNACISVLSLNWSL